MRRAAVFAVSIALACSATGCSTVGLLRGGANSPTSAPAPTGPLPASRLFGTPFPVSTPGGEATVTLENLRFITSYVYVDAVLVLDTRSVQASGQPVIDPEDVHAFEPGGREFERIAYPKGTVTDPLVRTVLQYPGQEVRGMIAWKVPRGTRIGRIDLVTPTSVNSLTVARQPVDPAATPSGAAATATTGGN